MAKQCIGIDVGGTTAKIGLLSAEGVILDKWEIPTRKDDNGSHILPDIAASVLEYLNRHGIGMADILGACRSSFSVPLSSAVLFPFA